MKILVGMPSRDSWGGPIASEPPFVAALRELGVDVREEVYVYGDKEKPTRFFERVRRVLETAFRFRRILKRETFDLIHLNTALDLKTLLRDSISIFLMNPGKTKIFLKIHGSESRFLETQNLLISFLRNYLKKRIHGVGVFSHEENLNFVKAGFPKEKIYFVKNPITIGEDLPENFSHGQKENDETFEILFISRFIATKGLLETIRACDILRKQEYKFMLHCLGDGELREEAEREVQRLNLQSKVKFTGYIPELEVSKYFFNSDIFVFPTRHAEGFPIVLFKAVAVGLPIVTTKIRAAADYLKEPENCLFSTSSPEDVSEKIIELIESIDLRRQMSANNLVLGESFKPQNIAREFLEIYRHIIND